MINKKPSTGINLLSGLLVFVIVHFLPFFLIAQANRQRVLLNDDWLFFKGDPADAKGIFYDVRPKVTDRNDNIVADTRADQRNTVASDIGLKKWVLTSSNDFIKNTVKHNLRP